MSDLSQTPSDVRPPDEKLRSISELAPQLRRKIRAVKRSILSDSAKLLYCCLNELMFLDFFSERRGVVKVGQPELARMLSWSVTKVERKARELESDRRLYRKIIHEGRSQKTLWHIREVVSSQMEFFHDADQSFVRNSINGRRPMQGANGKFLSKSSSRQIFNSGETEQNQAVNSNLPSPSRQFRRDSHGNSAVIETAVPPLPSPQNGHPHNGSSAVIVTADLPSSSRRNGAVHNGKAADVVTAVLPIKEDVPGQLDSLDVSFKRSTGFNARNGAGGAKKPNSENAFLLEVGSMMESWKKGSSKAELTGSGAWWRMSYRTDSDLMLRVLAEVLCMIKEGKIKFNPGSAAVDLWTRWGGPKLKREQKAAARAAAH